MLSMNSSCTARFFSASSLHQWSANGKEPSSWLRAFFCAPIALFHAPDGEEPSHQRRLPRIQSDVKLPMQVSSSTGKEGSGRSYNFPGVVVLCLQVITDGNCQSASSRSNLGKLGDRRNITENLALVINQSHFQRIFVSFARRNGAL